MNLSRRGFLLGATGTGALALLPILKTTASPLRIRPASISQEIAPTYNLSGTVTGRWHSSLTLINVGEIKRTFVEFNGNGIYFNGRFLPSRSLELNIYRDFTELNLLGSFRRFIITGPINMELRVDEVEIQEDVEELFWNHNEIEVDVVSENARYSGNFIISEYSMELVK